MRIINVEVNGEFIKKDTKNGGVQGEGNAATLHIVFDSTWDGYGKRVIFRDAQGANPVAVPLTKTVQEMMEDPANEYDAVIPSEALALPGWLSFTIEGYKEGETGTDPETKEPGEIALTVRDFLKVYENDTAYKPSEPTPSQAQQIMGALEQIVPDVRELAIEAKSWAVGGTGSREGEDTDNAKYYAQSCIDKAEEAAHSAQEAAQSAESAAQSATSADTSAQEAAKKVQDAQEEVEKARQEAVKSAEKATESQSWAVGGTGTRPGEDTNNAKYWSDEAQKSAGGGVRSFNGRTGSVMPQDGDYTAEMVGARPNTWMPSATEVGAISATEKGAPGGVATLDENGFVVGAQIDGFTKAETLTDETAALYGLGADAVPDDVLKYLSPALRSRVVNSHTFTEINESVLIDPRDLDSNKTYSIIVVGKFGKYACSVDCVAFGTGVGDISYYNYGIGTDGEKTNTSGANIYPGNIGIVDLYCGTSENNKIDRLGAVAHAGSSGPISWAYSKFNTEYAKENSVFRVRSTSENSSFTIYLMEALEPYEN